MNSFGTLNSNISKNSKVKNLLDIWKYDLKNGIFLLYILYLYIKYI
jgi:hypothetical protein